MDLFEDLNDVLDNDFVNVINFINRDRRPYQTRNRYMSQDNFNKFDDTEFIQRYRLSKDSVRDILELIENQLFHQSNRNNPIPPLQQLLITLRFYATGSFYITLGDFASIHKSTVCKIIHKVTNALITLRPNFIYLPQTEREQLDVMLKFHQIARFPRVIGAIDGTHIRLQSPGGEHAELFRNRKGYFSINTQVIADANCVIRDIVARWPGSAHDANIFDNSNARMRFENNQFANAVLLGDSGYPVRSYLIPPLNNPRTEAEILFNESQIRSCNVVERTFGIWKRRFPVLSVGLRCNLRQAKNIIVATAILHNAASKRNDYLPQEENIDMGEIAAPLLERNLNQNDYVRRNIIDYFSNL